MSEEIKEKKCNGCKEREEKPWFCSLICIPTSPWHFTNVVKQILSNCVGINVNDAKDIASKVINGIVSCKTKFESEAAQNAGFYRILLRRLYDHWKKQNKNKEDLTDDESEFVKHFIDDPNTSARKQKVRKATLILLNELESNVDKKCLAFLVDELGRTKQTEETRAEAKIISDLELAKILGIKPSEQLSKSSIAKTLGISISSLNRRERYLKKRLREIIGEMDADE